MQAGPCQLGEDRRGFALHREEARGNEQAFSPRDGGYPEAGGNYFSPQKDVIF